MNPVLEKGWTVDDLLLPAGIIIGATLLGLLVQIVVRRVLSGKAEKHGSIIARGVLRAFRGMLPLWFGLIALVIEFSELPLATKPAQVLHYSIYILTIYSVTLFVSRLGTVFVREYSSRNEAVGSRISILENLVRIVLFLFAALWMFHSMGVSITPILTALGVGGLAVALALQDTLGNLFAGLYIIMSKQLDPGDYIKLESGQEGVIIDIAWRVTVIRTPQNTIVIIPNSKFASSILTNYDRPERVNAITITFVLKNSADVEAIVKMLLTIANEVIASSDSADKSFPPLVNYIAMTESTVTITLALRVTDYRTQGVLRDAINHKFYSTLKLTYGQALPLAPPTT
jgi:small-conductance mechanosensitive channel